MSWVYRADPHECEKPPREEIEKAALGSVWKCDECGQYWKVYYSLWDLNRKMRRIDSTQGHDAELAQKKVTGPDGKHGARPTTGVTYGKGYPTTRNRPAGGSGEGRADQR